MSFNFVPLEQLFPQAMTGLAIKAAASTPAAGVAACETAIAVGTAIEQLAGGNPAAALAAVNAAIGNAKMDPAVASAVLQLVVLGVNQASLNAQIATFIPVMGATIEAVLTNIGKGVANAGSLDLAQYQAAARSAAAQNVAVAAPTAG